ncbi:hypothetical protein [Clostridium cellulovorans]|uniref:Uncharacterized protein n=1 Tax=Clostridium cellulovorans (strain ATCC 35296 / DSM 3052 / OCM 3 / 743B) TaxID=573061 RepID=D9SWD8_CLOC7|nr:hypothetical protein [Clostridium cellulovorans]ADL53220.1 hypothetical protein Clocel_3544 [Clostridium cellulovorans 743B]
MMLNGIFITIGVIIVIASRFLYGFYDITLGGDSSNDLKIKLALICDVLGTVLIVHSIANQLNLS